MVNCSLTHLADTFQFTAEIIDVVKGKCVHDIFSSTISWPAMQDRLSRVLNVHLAMLHAQFRFSTDAKGSLPFDLTCSEDLQQLTTMIEPLVVPCCLANGKRSTKWPKEVIVLISQKGGVTAGKPGAKVSCILQVF